MSRARVRRQTADEAELDVHVVEEALRIAEDAGGESASLPRVRAPLFRRVAQALVSR